MSTECLVGKGVPAATRLVGQLSQKVSVSAMSQWHDCRCSLLSLETACVASLLIVERHPLADDGAAYGQVLQGQGTEVDAVVCRGMTHDY